MSGQFPKAHSHHLKLKQATKIQRKYKFSIFEKIHLLNMQNFKTILLLAALAVFSAQASPLVDTVNEDKTLPTPLDYGDGRYLISAKKMTQTEAVAYCQNSGNQHLISIEDDLEDKDVQLFLSAAAYDNGIIGDAWTSGVPKDFYEKSYLWIVLDEEVQFENLQGADEGMNELTWATSGIALRQDPLQPTGQAWYLPKRSTDLHAICEQVNRK